MSRPKISLALVRLIVLALVLIAAVVTVAIVGTDGITDLLSDAADSRLGIAAFVGVYILGVVLMVPGTIFTLASGAILGFAVGFPVALVSALVGATIAFFIAKAVGKEGMNELLGDRTASIDDWLMENDFLSILILRLMPIVPFNGLNYASGLTAVRPTRYILASAIGIAPGAGLSSFAASRADEPGSAAFIGASIVLIVLVVGSAFAAKRFTSARKAKLAESGDA